MIKTDGDCINSIFCLFSTVISISKCEVSSLVDGLVTLLASHYTTDDENLNAVSAAVISEEVLYKPKFSIHRSASKSDHEVRCRLGMFAVWPDCGGTYRSKVARNLGTPTAKILLGSWHAPFKPMLILSPIVSAPPM
ncbi:uncharacterized protein LOC108677583 [Hyalella azteca]|uniref:Uncharacterized protein LOC108677583 n=1 Tax=Hyalella azteca TaxID=294128 RepID=A0A8B7P5A4_HYAAZ|nr:uncharacterized protein LOC108677583 [Hyalella azteca]